MSYKAPKTRVYHVFNPTLSAETAAHIPVIIGQIKQLMDYEPATGDQAQGFLCRSAIEQVLAYPSLGAGCIVETDSVRIMAREAMAGVQRGEFLADVVTRNPRHANVNSVLSSYFTALIPNQKNLFIFDTHNLSGASMIRAPRVGDSIKVRATSQDTIGQYADWMSTIKELVFEKAERVANGVGPAEVGQYNSGTTAPSEALALSLTAGDALATHVGLTVHSVFDPIFDAITDIDTHRHAARNKLAQYGLLSASQLRPRVVVTDVDLTGQVTVDYSSVLSTKTYAIAKADLVHDLAKTDTAKIWAYSPNAVAGDNQDQLWVRANTTEVGTWDILGGATGIVNITVGDTTYMCLASKALTSTGRPIYIDVRGIQVDGADSLRYQVEYVDGSWLFGSIIFLPDAGANRSLGGVGSTILCSVDSAALHVPGTGWTDVVADAVVTVTAGEVVNVGMFYASAQVGLSDLGGLLLDGIFLLQGIKRGTEDTLQKNDEIEISGTMKYRDGVATLGLDTVTTITDDLYEVHGLIVSGAGTEIVNGTYSRVDPAVQVCSVLFESTEVPGVYSRQVFQSDTDPTIYIYQLVEETGEWVCHKTDQADVAYAYYATPPIPLGPLDILPGPTWVTQTGPTGGVEPAPTVVAVQTIGTPSAQPSTEGYFDSLKSRTYAVEITSGGELGNVNAVITARVYAVDRSVPDRVTPLVFSEVSLAGNDYYTTTIRLGSDGATLTLTAPKAHKPVLITGDEWFVECTGLSGDKLVGVITTDSFPFYKGSDVATQRLDIEFLERMQNIELFRGQYDGAINWEIDPNGIKLFSELQVWDATLQAERTLSKGAELHAVYSAIDTAQVGTPFFYTGGDTRIRSNDPRNPVGYGVNAAAITATAPILVLSCGVDYEMDLVKALGKLERNKAIYHMAIMTYTASLQNLVDAHVKKMNGPEYSRWRRCFLSIALGDTLGMVGTDSQVMATIAANDSVSSRMELLSGSLEGVRTGDEIRFNFQTDYAGETSYDSALVNRVLSNTELLTQGIVPTQAVASNIQIWTATRPADVIERVGNRAKSLNYWQTQLISPSGKVQDADQEYVDSYFITASLAGLSSAAFPHESLTEKSLTSWYSVDGGVAGDMLEIELNELAECGVLILTGNKGLVTIRHDLTTNMTSVETREGMVARNVLDLSYRYKAALDPFRCVSNISNDLLAKIRKEIDNMTTSIKTTTEQGLLGAQLNNATITSLIVPEGGADSVYLEMGFNVPVVLNNVDLKIVISGKLNG